MARHKLPSRLLPSPLLPSRLHPSRPSWAWLSLAVAGALACLAAPAVQARSAAADPIERFTATAVNMSGVGPTGMGTIEIGIERWSTDSERDRLKSTLIDKGPDALLRQLQKMRRVGYIRTPQSLGWPIHFARTLKLEDGGRQVIVATDRPMSFWEASRRPRSADYAFTLVDIRFDGDGKGVGKLAVASRITANQKTGMIEIENFGTEPVRLTEVRSSVTSK